MAVRPFEESLAYGQIGESRIAKWLMWKCEGCSILPVYEKEIDTGKGPRIFRLDGDIVAPDMLAFSPQFRDPVIWIEAKHKTVFTWHRITERWTTGIDLKHYEHYQEVAKQSEWPVWLLFLHVCGTPDRKDLEREDGVCPSACPVGLFGGHLSELAEKENHRHASWGPSGMVYWAHETLIRLASLDEVEQAVVEVDAIRGS